MTTTSDHHFGVTPSERVRRPSLGVSYLMTFHFNELAVRLLA